MHQVCTCIHSLFELLPLQILCANNNIIINISLSVLDFKGNNKKTSFLNWLLGQDLYLLFPRISLFPLVQSQRIFQCFTCSTVFSQTNKTDILTNNIIHSESLHQKKYQHHPYVQSLYIFTGKKISLIRAKGSIEIYVKATRNCQLRWVSHIFASHGFKIRSSSFPGIIHPWLSKMGLSRTGAMF